VYLARFLVNSEPRRIPAFEDNLYDSGKHQLYGRAERPHSPSSYRRWIPSRLPYLIYIAIIIALSAVAFGAWMAALVMSMPGKSESEYYTGRI
jgi:hypothetical protein